MAVMSQEGGPQYLPPSTNLKGSRIYPERKNNSLFCVFRKEQNESQHVDDKTFITQAAVEETGQFEHLPKIAAPTQPGAQTTS